MLNLPQNTRNRYPIISLISSLHFWHDNMHSIRMKSKHLLTYLESCFHCLTQTNAYTTLRRSHFDHFSIECNIKLRSWQSNASPGSMWPNILPTFEHIIFNTQQWWTFSMSHNCYPTTFRAEGVLSLPASIRLSTRLSACPQNLPCPHDNSPQMSARITKHASWDILSWYWKWRSLTLTFKVILTILT